MGTLHFVGVGDTNDDNIGETVALDLASVPKLVEAAAAAAGMRFSGSLVSGDRFHAATIRAQVSALPIQSDDAVVYYYSGHGARSQSKADAWPVMALGGDGFGGYDAFDLAWVYGTLRERRPRMLLVAVDCCQQEVEDGILNDLAFAKALRAGVNPSAARALFGDFQGEVLAMSCRPGELSRCHPAVGGFFTSRFVAAIGATLTSRMAPNWDGILAASANIDASQNPIWKVVSGRGPSGYPPGLEPFPGSWRCLAGGRPLVRRMAPATPTRGRGSRGATARSSIVQAVRAKAPTAGVARGLPSTAAAPDQAKSGASAPFCTSCGTKLRPTVKFCTSCGHVRG